MKVSDLKILYSLKQVHTTEKGTNFDKPSLKYF